MSFHARGEGGDFGWDPSQRAVRNMLETLTNDIGLLREQLRDVDEKLKRKNAQMGVMSTTITQQNEELIKLKSVEGRFQLSFGSNSEQNLPFGTSIRDFNENIRTRMGNNLVTTQILTGLPNLFFFRDNIVEYLKFQIYDSILEYDEEEDIQIIKYSLNDLDCLFHFLDEDIKTNPIVRVAMMALQEHIIAELVEEHDGDLRGWMNLEDIEREDIDAWGKKNIRDVFERHFS
jgi:hypothetical protein